MREKVIEQRVVRYCQKQGLVIRKVVSPGSRGFPDRVIMGRGKVLFLELKAPGKQPEPLQLREMRLIEKAGLAVAWGCDFVTLRRLIDFTFGTEDLV